MSPRVLHEQRSLLPFRKSSLKREGFEGRVSQQRFQSPWCGICSIDFIDKQRTQLVKKKKRKGYYKYIKMGQSLFSGESSALRYLEVHLTAVYLGLGSAWGEAVTQRGGP